MSNSIKSYTQQRYSQFAAGYVSSETHSKGADLDLILKMADPQADWRMLDIATGGGHTIKLLAPYVRMSYATDLTLNMLREARQANADVVAPIDYVVSDAETLSFADASFDLVTCRIAAHHFPSIKQFVREVTRVLRPGGLFILQDQLLPNHKKSAYYVDAFERLRDPSHVRALPMYLWKKHFEENHLTIEATHIVQKRHDLITWSERQGCDAQTIQRLRILLLRAPERVQEWMQPLNIMDTNASFINQHILIKGVKHG